MLELRIVTVFVLCFETCNIESPSGTGFNPHASIFAVKLRKTIRTGPPLILERGRPVEITVARDCKRGADLPPPQAVMQDAHQKLAPGEIYDFEYTPPGPGRPRLEVVNSGLNSKILQPIEVQ